MSKERVRQHLREGRPYTPDWATDGTPLPGEIARLGRGVEDSCVELHKTLYDGLSHGDPRVVVFTDNESEPNKYISLRDRKGQPCFGNYTPGDSATDIGVRGANPRFEGVLNPTTVIHADIQALDDYRERGAPTELLEALDAVKLFNNYITNNVVKPHLREVAEAFGLSSQEYLAHFFPEGVRPHTLTRVIMYHLDAKEGMRPIGEQDGVPLLIKAHKDKSAYTYDSVQTSSGLQYYESGQKKWVNAGTEVASFRGDAESFLPEFTPPTPHRVVFEEGLEVKAAPHLTRVGLGRVAIPTFVSPTPLP